MLKKIRLFHALKNARGPFVLLPDGLYTLRNRYVRDSGLLRPCLKYDTGDVLEFADAPRFRGWEGHFKRITPYQSGEFRSVNVRELDLAQLLKEIRGMHFNPERNPFENFLEVALIKSLMQSLNNSKSLLGGIWSTGGLMTGGTGYGRNTFAYFARNIEEKNSIILTLKEKLEEYPENFVKMLADYGCSPFNRSHSQAGTFLEYRILQVKYKIVLQELCLHSHYLTADEKKKFDDELKLITRLLSTFPARLA